MSPAHPSPKVFYKRPVVFVGIIVLFAGLAYGFYATCVRDAHAPKMRLLADSRMAQGETMAEEPPLSQNSFGGNNVRVLPKLTSEDKARGVDLLEQAKALEKKGNANHQRAFALYKQAAELGCAEAWYHMGRLALANKVKGINPKQILDWFKNAADAGHADAYAALARAYLEGRLTKTDIPKADYYLDLALAAGNAEAKFLKGSLLIGSRAV